MTASNKQATAALTAHHFDDEPETMDWIPDSLFNYYRRRHPSWTKEEVASEEREGYTGWSFRLVSDHGVEVKINYRIYPRPADFHRLFRPEGDDVALLDVMTQMEDGALATQGLEFYKLACQKLAPDRVYILSGFPGKIREVIPHLPQDHLIVKPPDAGEIIRMLVAKFEPAIDRLHKKG
jgi:hypothetical protein